MAALDSATAGEVFIGDTELTTLNDAELTRIRRDKIGFVFQAYNLVPTLTAQENITLPLDIAGKKVDQEWFDTVVSTVRLRRPARTQAERALRWATTTGRLCSCARQQTGHRLRRRADWKPRLPIRSRGPGLPPSVGQRVRSDDCDGHP